jgi:hypothetical protein
MTTFQLDECLNDRKFAENFNADAKGEVQTFRYPKRLKGVDDPAVLADLLPRGNPLVSTDRALPAEYAGHICTPHPGIVFVCHSPDEPATITTKRAAAILAGLKGAVTGWPSLLLTNSIVFLSEMDVEVCHVEAGKLVRGRHLRYTDSDWVTEMTGGLACNAARHTLPPA